MTDRDLFKGPFDGRPWAFAGATLALLLAALNLRGGIVVVGPLVEDIAATLHFSASEFSLLTTLPLICFGLVSALVPRLTRSLVPPLLVLISLALISLGAWLRISGSYTLILLGTLALGSAIAVLNVLIPGLVKGYFPRQPGVMTGLYAVTLGLGAGLGVYLAVPLRDLFGNWRAPMLLWALLPLVCLLPWLYMLRVRSQNYRRPADRKTSLWRNRRAWALTGFMGLQSLFFYSLATWLPKLLIDAGLSDEAAGLAASMINLVGIPANLITPMIATRMTNLRPLMLVIALLGIGGLGGLLLAPTAAPLLWASLCGLGGGASLSLALTLFALRTESSEQATALSSMAQSIGYLIAALGPWLIGSLHQLSGHWLSALLLLILLQILQCALGWVVALPKAIHSAVPTSR